MVQAVSPSQVLALLGAVLVLMISPTSAARRLSQATAGLTREAEADAINFLPGYCAEANDCVLPSAQYSGYVTVDDKHQRKLFYYFVESERDPDNDPVVLWLNGGPGCSSFDGFIFEQGPFIYHLQGGSTNWGVRLSDNPHAWNKVANMLFVDSPAGVGLSYSRVAADYVTNDTHTARDANAFLRGFFSRFPRFQQNDFYVSGESYAGVYVPNLSLAVAVGNDEGQTPHINIKGYLVGNGCTDPRYDGNAHPLFAMGKSLLSYREWQAMQVACGGGEYWNWTDAGGCAQYMQDLQEDIAMLNVYDVLEDCFHGGPAAAAGHAAEGLASSGSRARAASGGSRRHRRSALSTAAASGSAGRMRSKTSGAADGGAGGARAPLRGAEYVKRLQDAGLLGVWPLPGSTSKPGPTLNWAHVQRRLGLTPPCTDSRCQVQVQGGSAASLAQHMLTHTPRCTDSRAADLWLNDPEVRSALHAAPASVIGPWTLCSDKISYTRDTPSMIPVHKALIAKHGLRGLVYSGDHDMAVPHTGSEAWTGDMGYEVTSPWQPWFVADEQVAGYVVEYGPRLTYATVKGAGHMVPETNPREALAMFQRFIDGESLAPGPPSASSSSSA